MIFIIFEVRPEKNMDLKKKRQPIVIDFVFYVLNPQTTVLSRSH